MMSVGGANRVAAFARTRAVRLISRTLASAATTYDFVNAARSSKYRGYVLAVQPGFAM